MYIRLTRARFDQANYDAARDTIGDLIDSYRQQPGFLSYYTAIDRSQGMLIVVSTWDTQEHVQVERSVLGDAVPRLRESDFQLEAPEVYEVVDQS